MTGSQEDSLLTFRRGRDLFDRRLAQASDAGRAGRAEAVAHALRDLWPGSPLCYCRLAGGVRYAADQAGIHAPAWADALEAPAVACLGAAGAAPATLPAPPGPAHVARVPGGGLVAVAFPADVPPGPASAVLAELGEFLGARLLIEECREREWDLLLERKQQTSLCALADMVGPVSHELQNVFNNIILQAAIISRDVPEAVRPEVEVIRGVGRQASQMMHRLDEYRYRIQAVRRPVDLNAVVAAALDELGSGGSAPAVTVGADLARSLPRAWGNDSDLRRLVLLLVRNARSALEAQGGGTVTVRTGKQADKVVLRVEDDGPAVGDDPGQVFDPFAEPRPGANGLELAACVGLMRKLRSPAPGAPAAIRAENRDPRGLVIVVELEAVK